jgi:hypothetical protein
MVRVKQRLDLDDGGGGYGMVLMAAHLELVRDFLERMRH